MLKNQFLITLRNLWKQGTFTAINVAGLTLGITICLIIYLFVKEEMSYDSFHSDSENTYRLLRIGNLNGEKYFIGVSSSPYADALINDFPQDVASTTRVLPANGLVSFEDKHFIEDRLFLADSNFLETFSFPLVAGDKETALNLPNSVILTQETAEKYFGDADPLNKTITVDNQLDFIVTGVFGEAPAKSHLQFDMVANLAPLRQVGFMTSWWSNGLITYVTLNEGVDIANLESQFPAFMDKYMGEDFERMQNRTDITLQPLSDVYFESDIKFDSVLHGNKSSIYIFSAVGIFIFIIACINFMNLATAKSVQRAKEVGIRKTLGSTRTQLTFQFFGESITIATISVILAFTLTEVSLPLFNQWFLLDLTTEREFQVMIPMAIGIILISGFISGLYPALVLSGFKPASVLKGKISAGNSGFNIRKGLVVLQFCISVFLIVLTLVVSKQLNYIHNKELGFEKDAIVLIELNYNTINENIDTFKERLLTHSSIKSVALSSGAPGGFHDTMAAKIEGEEDQPRFRALFTDENYIPTYGVELVAGRNFSKDMGTDRDKAVILNETAVREMGWTNEEALTKRMYPSFRDSVYKQVIGVVKDYHFSSLRDDVDPLMVYMGDQSSLLSVKLQSGTDIQETLAFIEEEWGKFVPFKPEFDFMDDTLNHLYQDEQLQARLFQLFSGVSIFIACLGIFGLASFTASQRKREIGIRKSLGASVQNISRLLAKDYVKLVIIANMVAWPLSWYFSGQWLESFAYRTDIGLTVFIIALFAALSIAVLSVVFQSVRAAMANPVDVLKEE